ncbi:Sjogren's syndrome/scleroderma autoantigen 1 family protein [Halobellus captivus]|uniref:Sjogren's syndrome/scleroderma autoantigen 1 family protein n=1 Tax=Halobellus captivus TaxID=2592614 RepID=UPI00119F9A7D|nr:Sjogren's syndrome/scleroderma autoantigen 1 family protein [Halobellus captivus]
MSDFDEEAERKRLREKYEQDEERRKETQQMSELLLKGATMTNRHCDDCGAPIFRYQGQEFCPSCQRTTGGGADGQARAGGQEGQASADHQPATNERAAKDEGGPTVEAAESGRAEPGASAARPGAESGNGERASATGRETAAAVGGEGASPTDGETVSPIGAAGAASTDSRQTSAGSDNEAREALLRALTQHARLAEETDDPRRAKDHLAAAREAAAALDELE